MNIVHNHLNEFIDRSRHFRALFGDLGHHFQVSNNLQHITQLVSSLWLNAPVIRKAAMNKNNDKFNDQVKREVEELHKLKENIKKTEDPKIKQRIERLYNKRDDQ